MHQVRVHFALFAQKEGVETLNWLSIQALCPDFGSCWDDEAGFWDDWMMIGMILGCCVRILGPAGMMRPDDLAHKWSTGPGA